MKVEVSSVDIEGILLLRYCGTLPGSETHNPHELRESLLEGLFSMSLVRFYVLDVRHMYNF